MNKLKSPIQPALDQASWATSHLPIRLFGDPILTRTCETVTAAEFDSGQAEKWAQEMIDFLTNYRRHSGAGRGLAANQIGVSKQIVLLLLDSVPRIFVNPELVSSDGEATYPESCISSGALMSGAVVRPWSIVMSYAHAEGSTAEAKFDGLEARVLQHELDHLKGQICPDKYLPGTFKMLSGDPRDILKPIERSK
jgi:peptide deformylase